MLISEAQLLEVLRRQNSWWRTGAIPQDLAPEFKRLAFYETLSLLKQPNLNRAIILSGARRVGKTVLLHQLAQDAIKNDRVQPNQILYITFEDLTLTQANLREILSLYERYIAQIAEGTLILLDEIHYAANWGRWLMTVLREYPKARIVATGSAAVLLRGGRSLKVNPQETPDTSREAMAPEGLGAGESGVGRWVSVHVPTLSFYEYIALRKQPLPNLAEAPTLTALIEADAKRQEAILSSCLPLEREFHQYILQGGFPAAVVAGHPLPTTQRLLREDVIDKALKRDMAHLYGARSLGELDQIFVYLCFNFGTIVEKNTLASNLGVAASTVENHLQRLEDAHLIYRLPPCNLQGKKSLKPRPKVYVADPSLRNAVILRGEGIFDDERELSSLVEGCVYKHLYAFYYPERPRFGYWRSPRGGHEVDFVLIFPDGSQAAYEVKYSEHPRLESKDGLVQWVTQGKASEPTFLITKNTADFGPTKGHKIFQIPAFVFCFLLGHIEMQRWVKDIPRGPGEAPFGQKSEPLPKEAVKHLPKTERPETKG